MSKNNQLLKYFTAYCEQHPEERFWQALRNFSGYAFIYGQQGGEFVSHGIDIDGKKVDLFDTFNE